MCPSSCFSPATKLLGEPLMSFLRFGRGKLHRKIEKAICVAFRMALDKPYQLLCRCHNN